MSSNHGSAPSDPPKPEAGRGRWPDFVIGGAQKSGTTALHVLLGAHPEVFFPDSPQELDFFDRDDVYARGLEWYRRHFRAAGDRRAGQTSTQYLYAPASARRIARDLGDVRLIFIIRDPADRAWSHYWHCVKYGLEAESFTDARRLEPGRLARGGDGRRWYSYLDRGFYARQLEPYLERFGRDRVLVLLTEELASDPGGVIDRCFDFLGVPRVELDAGLLARRWNAARLPRWARLQRWTARLRFLSPAGRRLARGVDRLNLVRRPYPPMAAAERAEVAAIFADANRQLAARFDLDLEAWSGQGLVS